MSDDVYTVDDKPVVASPKSVIVVGGGSMAMTAAITTALAKDFVILDSVPNLQSERDVIDEIKRTTVPLVFPESQRGSRRERLGPNKKQKDKMWRLRNPKAR